MLTRLDGAALTAGCSVRDAVPGYEVEPSLAADPSGQTIVGAWQQDRVDGDNGGTAANVIAVSTDAGASFATQLVGGVAACGGGSADRVSDPWAAVAPDGTIYVASIAVDPNSTYVQSSRDGGATWTGTSVSHEGYEDKETIAVDPHVPGRAWLAWSEGSRFRISRTDDFGQTWSSPHPIGGRIGFGQVFDIHLLPVGGDRLLAVSSYGNSYGGDPTLTTAVSDDAGATWAPRRDVHNLIGASLVTRDGRVFRADAEIFSAAAAGDDVWVAMQGARGIHVFFSPDGGVTWQRRVFERRRGAGTPTIAASPDGRSVAVSYLSLDRDRRRDKPVTVRWRRLVTRDGGAHWRDRPLTRTFDARRARSAGRIFLGDYTGLAPLGAGGAFGALVTVAGAAAVSGRTDVAFVRVGGDS